MNDVPIETKNYWIIETAKEVATVLTEKYGATYEEWLTAFINSSTGKNLMNPETDLWGQSPLYVCDAFEEEVGIGPYSAISQPTSLFH